MRLLDRNHRAAARPQEPVVAILDEIPYLADVDRGALTVLQNWWDENKRLVNLKLFLCGSYVAFMERQVLDANAPLYNRRTRSMKLESFRARREVTHEIRCNWKVYVENYLEGYHIPLVHPSLNTAIDAARYEVELRGDIVFHHAPSRGGTRRVVRQRQ